MIVLSIETSCDETGVAVYDDARGLLAHELFTQAALHQRYGGVVPELASRDHIKKLLPLVRNVLDKAGITKAVLNGIAYTVAPGLAGALLVGACFGRALAYGLKIPAIGVHHLEAHLLAVMLEDHQPEFPFLALLVSGGHTLLIEVKAFGQYEILGDTLDDAVGEAFDKVAKLLGLPYPGGPHLAKLAREGNSTRFHFPRPMKDRPGLDFSFSGLKTFALNTLAKENNDQQTKADIAVAFEQAVVETLVVKCQRALEKTGLKQLVVAGGVGANRRLRNELNALVPKHHIKLFFPRLEFCTDNGAMIAYTGCQRLLRGEKENLDISIWPRKSLEELN